MTVTGQAFTTNIRYVTPILDYPASVYPLQDLVYPQHVTSGIGTHNPIKYCRVQFTKVVACDPTGLGILF